MKKVFFAATAALFVAAAGTSAVVMSAGPAAASSAGAQFKADRTALSAASSAFSQAFSAWQSSGKPISQTSSFANAYASAIETDDHTLLSQGWPTGSIADIDALVRGDAAVEGVVVTLPGLASSATSDTDWFIAFNQDAAVAVADANVVRRDFGLPLASLS
jgi:hypothetical protein